MFKSSNRNLLITFLALVAVMMYLLNRFTPLFCDDWHYAFVFGTPHTPIQSVGDILRGQWEHYFVFNGRFIVHFFLQYFDGILGKGVFNVFNTLVFVFFLYITALLTTGNRENHYKVVSVAFMLIFLVMTGFKYGCLWLSGSMNYMWVGAALLLFHYLLGKGSQSTWSRVLLFIFSVVCGWSNEAFVVGVGAAYFLYYLFNRKELTPHRVLMLSGFFLGSLFLVFAPASIYRATHSSLRLLSLTDRIINMRNLRLFFVLLFIALAWLVINKKSFIAWVKRERLLITATLAIFAFIIFTGANYEQSRLGIEFYSLVLILKSINWSRIDRRVISIGNVAIMAFAGFVIFTCSKCYAVCQQELRCVERGDDMVLTTQPIKPTSYLRRYVLDYMGTYLTSGIDDDKVYGEEDFITRYYGWYDKFVCFLPKAFIDDLNAHPQAYNQFHTLDGLPFYAMRLSEGQSIRYANFIYEPSRFSSWPWPLNRLISKLSNEIEVFQDEPRFVTINNERYALVAKTHPSQESRLREIRIIDFPEWSKPVLTSKPEVLRRHFFQ